MAATVKNAWAPPRLLKSAAQPPATGRVVLMSTEIPLKSLGPAAPPPRTTVPAGHSVVAAARLKGSSAQPVWTTAYLRGRFAQTASVWIVTADALWFVTWANQPVESRLNTYGTDEPAFTARSVELVLTPPPHGAVPAGQSANCPVTPPGSAVVGALRTTV